jgi:hypothetical protein
VIAAAGSGVLRWAPPAQHVDEATEAAMFRAMDDARAHGLAVEWPTVVWVDAPGSDRLAETLAFRDAATRVLAPIGEDGTTHDVA